MHKWIFSAAVLSIALSTTFCAASEEKPQGTKQEAPAVDPTDIPKISKAFGHIVGQNLVSLGLDFDMQEVIHGIQDSLNGIDPPLSESECFQAITAIQENAFKKESEKNLTEAEEFLAKNKKEKNVVELEDGKLQYITLQEGKGDTVEAHHSPVVRYKGKFLDGKIFGESQSDETISLEETIPGFKTALVGMKEGEKREIFIHPSLGYGTSGYLAPNSLLTFEIEIVKANAPPKADDEQLSSASQNDNAHHEELASIDPAKSGVK